MYNNYMDPNLIKGSKIVKQEEVDIHIVRGQKLKGFKW